MPAYQTLRNCLDVKENLRSIAAKSLQRYTPYTEYFTSSIHWPHIHRVRYNVILEAFSAPIKYATFQALGIVFLHLISHFHVVHLQVPSVITSTKLCAVGGSFLALLHIAMIMATSDVSLLKRKYTPETTRRMVTTVIQEILYSAVAGVLGSLACSSTSQYNALIMATAGALGPLLFMVVGAGAIFTYCVTGIIIQRTRTWYRAY